MGIFVKRYNNELPEHLMKRFRRKMMKENVMDELSKRSFYVSESQKKREQLKKARYANQFKRDY